MAKDPGGSDSDGGIFEGSNHVLKGVQQQLEYWKALKGHDAEKQLMVPALTQAADALREALKRAKPA